MVRRVKAKFTASDDPDFEVVEEQAVLIAPDMIIEANDGEWTFLLIPAVSDDQDVVEVDRAKCGYFALAMSHEPELNYDFLAEVSLLDFIRSYAKK
ncbi:hypothetical protein J7E81_01430 [Bacillus sp. ISL-18]|uniref:hypothetical protein n=1 Tax=Bacillus sp. ISL-18 TaxID=2819118 RepID=UPI001BE91FBF|nr:hypothetical protein [Bacillus sp. ISL-18]MBT2653907.1 hypothetical protein [Bacillus sp. ISL-18]